MPIIPKPAVTAKSRTEVRGLNPLFLMTKKTLYSFRDDNGDTVTGTHVGTNSQDLYILEVKGRDDYIVRDPREIEEVIPYTFSVNINGQEIHYRGEPKKVSVGDFFLVPAGNSFCVARVKEVDTKNRNARVELKGHKILTEEI